MRDEVGAAVPAHAFGQRMRAHLHEIERANVERIGQVVERLLQCFTEGGIIFTGGAGHSLGAVGETFYRAGGLACVRPLYDDELWPLHGARASTQAERRPGLARRVLDATDIGMKDILVVFSNSGVNPYPVELAWRARRVGCDVVAITSLAAMGAAPRRADATLVDHATYILDTRVPPRDVAYPKNRPRTGPLSSVANNYLWNMILASLTDRAEEAGVELPLWHSANVSGGDQHNDTWIAQYARRIPEISTE